MGSLFGSTKMQTSTSSSDPWKDQVPYLQEAFSQAQNIYNSQKDTPAYQGNLYTGLNNTQMAGINGIGNWVNGSGAALSNAAAQGAYQGLGDAVSFGNNATNFAGGNFGQVPASQAGVLSSFGRQALGDYQGIQSGLNNFLTTAQNDPTQANISNAQQYANSGALQQQIDAAAGDVNHSLGTDLVGLNNQASAGGNLNSSRAGAAEAAMRGEAARTLGNLSAQMRSNAYTTGLQLAEQARQSNMGSSLSALNQQGTLAGQGLNALNLAEQARQSEIKNRLSANAQLGQSAQLGYEGADVANGLGLGNANALLGAGGILQDDANAQNAANFQAWQMQDSRANDLLSRYYKIIGAGNWGQTTTQTTPVQQKGILDQGLGLAQKAASVYSSFCWVAREVYGEENPKWRQFRFWMITKSPNWFYHLYLYHGEEFSRFISNKPKLKSAIRFIFDKILDRNLPQES